MTKQEEIKRIVWQHIRMSEANMSDHYSKTIVVDGLIKDLSEHGVVLKVDEEPIKGGYYGKDAKYQIRLVEPLIEE